MTTGIDLVAVGEVMLELTAPTSLDRLPPLTPAAAGDTFNVTAVAAALSARTAYVGLVGDDPAGDAVVAGGRARQVDMSSVRRVPGGRTGLYLVTVDRTGERSFHYYRSDSAARSLTPAVLAGSPVHHARAVHTSGITMRLSDTARDTAVIALRTARQGGALTSYDVNYRSALATIDAAVDDLRLIGPHTSLVTLSAEEATTLLGTSAVEETARLVWTLTEADVLIGLGAAGAALAVRRTRTLLHARPPHVACIDSSGAGDALVGAFIASVLRGTDAETALRRACAAATHAISGRGALGAVAMPSDVDRLVADVELP